LRSILIVLRALAIFVAAAVIGYIFLVFSWITYTSVFDIADPDGGKGMEIVFVIAPVAAAAVGVMAAGLLSHRTPRGVR
jgi:hypothetical protein